MSTTVSSRKTVLEEFREELPIVWQQIPDKTFFFGLLAAWLALFYFLGNPTFGYIKSSSLFTWMYDSYNAPNSDDTQGNLIPFIVLGLFWWKRKELLATPKQFWLPGLFFLGGATLLHVFGYLIQQPRVSIVAMLVGVYALIALVWGPRFALASFFPLFLLVFSIPVGTLSDRLTVPLRHYSTDIAVAVARHALGIPVLQQGVQIFDPKGTYSYQVAAACSGIRSLTALTALMAIYAWMTFRTGWKRLLILALAIPLALLGNVVRLVGIIVASQAFGKAAGEFVHNWFGFVTFALALAAMLAVGHWLREPPTPPAAPEVSAAPPQ